MALRKGEPRMQPIRSITQNTVQQSGALVEPGDNLIDGGDTF